MVTYVTNPNAMHETIDGETIVIDLSTGTYYSLRGAGPAIWNAVASGASPEEVVAGLESAYEAAPGEIAAATEAFLSELEAEQLIARGNGAASAQPTPIPPGARSAFEQPRLEKYEDLQDIVLLDPVHMVDDQGWPHRAPAGNERG
ncbi:MAG TPA: PqqD family protein [Gaiellaceae bacterium]|nr:PqqD family protein [Gaiellaceae bacterium]